MNAESVDAMSLDDVDMRAARADARELLEVTFEEECDKLRAECSRWALFAMLSLLAFVAMVVVHNREQLAEWWRSLGSTEQPTIFTDSAVGDFDVRFESTSEVIAARATPSTFELWSGGRAFVIVDLETGAVEVDPIFTVHEGAQHFWETVSSVSEQHMRFCSRSCSCDAASIGRVERCGPNGWVQIEPDSDGHWRAR